MQLFERLKLRDKGNVKRIVLPEGTEERNLKAADMIIADGLAKIILLGNPEEVNAKANALGLTNIGNATIIDPTDNANIDKYAPLFFELRKSKGISMDDARRYTANATLLRMSDGEGRRCGRNGIGSNPHHRRRSPRRFSGYKDSSGNQYSIRRIHHAFA